MKKIVVLTGAGISAESGLSTFRDNDGLWDNFRIEDVATPEAFAANPALVYDFYQTRREQLGQAGVVPNPAHIALATLAKHADLTLVTQNVDDLHERAGSPEVLHMHGELVNGRCLTTGAQYRFEPALSGDAVCPCCGEAGRVRPDIVWFGEMPFYMREIEAALAGCDLFVSIGTSGQVYPAAGFVEQAKYYGAQTLELNMEATSESFDEQILGPASEVVPRWVDSLLQS